MVGLWLFCIIDVSTTRESQIRNLPKIVWLFVVIGLPDLGSLAWLVAGRTWDARPTRPDPRAGRFPEYDRPGRHIAANPNDDEAFLRQVRERAEQQRQEYEARRRAEVEHEDRRSKGEE